MSRLILAIVVLVALAVIVSAALQGLRRALRAGDDALNSPRAGGPLMQKLSFVILVALILYVSLWGGG